ncbi:hypothetical protein BDV23DRAFT_43508 [Aspergillus alliaceus]|uniref:Uncharacterized protein n=1 Tax=Petromyces alliaceus TaxID=209559 RepID=A0A5N7BQP0_PETAA|nr:hypothetical protein BDV23DRAFT_43508 [Aspergillus alliaceus]
MESSSYPSRLDQLSPPHSLPEQTWKADMSHPTSPSEVHDTGEDATLLPERLAKLAHMASQNAHVSTEDTTAVYHCLDTLEALFDPRPKLTQEIVKCRPPRIYPETSTLVAPSSAYPSPMEDRAASVNEPFHPQLQALLNEVTALNVELNQRREESFRIYALLMRESQGLSRRISELEDEVHELESDIVEDSAEREALQGTVRGLEAWINAWQKEPDLAGRAPGTLRQNQAKRRMKRQQEEHNESGTDALLEGITAWMRGWKDVEEGFRIRERDREVKREERRTKVATEPADNT